MDEQLKSILVEIFVVVKESTNSAIADVKNSMEAAIAEVKESTDVAVTKVDAAVIEITKMSSGLEQVEKSIQDVRESTTTAVWEIKKRIQQLETKGVPKEEGATNDFDCPMGLEGISTVPETPPGPKIKTSIFDGKSAWNVYKMQFDMVAMANGWSDAAKAYNLAESLLDIRDTLALEYFVDAIRNPDIQTRVRLSDAKDLKSALMFSMKIDTAHLASEKSSSCPYRCCPGHYRRFKKKNSKTREALDDPISRWSEVQGIENQLLDVQERWTLQEELSRTNWDLY
ncbi:hypothetical protein HNY73_000061 [Argiope bruennichi]|uniref:Uncharacterized protein n=1 Tax=Argiope bruennichi TaxID=94029 RepID=A0A8T0FXT3_ARGBR|nr:hypothetical protein HNY73_000061 [Argiope bruennichi]